MQIALSGTIRPQRPSAARAAPAAADWIARMVEAEMQIAKDSGRMRPTIMRVHDAGRAFARMKCRKFNNEPLEDSR